MLCVGVLPLDYSGKIRTSQKLKKPAAIGPSTIAETAIWRAQLNSRQSSLHAGINRSVRKSTKNGRVLGTNPAPAGRRSPRDPNRDKIRKSYGFAETLAREGEA